MSEPEPSIVLPGGIRLPVELEAELKKHFPNGLEIKLDVRIDLSSITKRTIDVSLLEHAALASASPEEALAAVQEALRRGVNNDDHMLRSIGPEGRQKLVDWCLKALFPQGPSAELVDLVRRQIVKP